MKRHAAFGAGLLAAALVASAPLGTAETRETDPRTQGPRFLGPDGERPFLDDAEALEFLRTAKVVRSRRAEGGVSGARKLLLDIVEALSPHLDEPEIDGVLQRRRLLVDLLEARIEEKGPGRVLFSLAYARPPR